MNDTINVGSVIVKRMDYKARFTGKSLPTFGTCSIVDGMPAEDGHYEAIVGEIFNVFSIECEGEQYVGLQAQIDHEDSFLILSTDNYLTYTTTGIFDSIKL